MAERDPEKVRMSFGDHLEDLRRRVILGLLGVGGAAVVMLIFGTRIFKILCDPLLNVLTEKGLPPQVQFFTVSGAFMAYLKISLVGGLVAGAPWLIYQFWKFVEAGLYPSERRLVLVLAPFSGVMALVGVVFMYFAMLPVCLRFFVAFVDEFPRVASGQGGAGLPGAALPGGLPGGVPMVNLLVEGGNYIDFVAWITLGIVVGFQLPVVMLVLGWSRLVDAAFLKRYRRHCIFICFVLGSVLTPADPVSLFVLALPLWALFELGLVLMRVSARSTEQTLEASPPAEVPGANIYPPAEPGAEPRVSPPPTQLAQMGTPTADEKEPPTAEA
ncbi:MAG: twin-arginine translocase subunit TatC [Phycisphaeraceae bacterium]|nr:twin-arginine translocase subunit TatC [Phycisphaeraceae bacterium]